MFSTAAWSNPRYYADAASAHGNVFKFQHLTRPAVGIVGISTIEQFLRAHAAHLEVPPAPFNEIIPSGFVRYLSGRDHDRVATAIRAALNPAVVAHHDCRLADEAVQAIDLLDEGKNIESVLDELTLRIMLALFFDAGKNSDAKLRDLFHDADYRRLSVTGRTHATAAVRGIIDEMRFIALDNGRISFLSHLAKQDPAAINDDAILANLAYSLHTGRLDVSGLLHWIIATAGSNPVSMQKLRDASELNPDSACRSGGLADRMVRETLRLHQSEFLMRRTTKEIQFNDYRIPAGWHVRLCIAESHRSPEAFPDSAVFDPDRFLESRSRSTYAPFGFTPRACPGEHLARVIGRHFLVALARRPLLEISQDKPWEFTGFHWKPSSRMQLRLSHRS